jgi:hypothetical protein
LHCSLSLIFGEQSFFTAVYTKKRKYVKKNFNLCSVKKSKVQIFINIPILKQHILIFFLFTSTLFSFSFAQTMNIRGQVNDTLNHVPVVKAVAMLIRLRDSVLVDFRRTDENGKFEFLNIPMDTVQLIVSHPKFTEKSFYIFASPENHDFDISNIVLPAFGHDLKEVTVFAYKDPVYYNGDTLVYIADSFKVRPNAVVEDLLKKLPGIDVSKDGSITSQGKAIKKVYVDGDEFFGSDPTIATKNLSAQGVESVQVYEEKNKDATESGDETIQVMNLKLKDEFKKGYFGRVSGATDFYKFYEGELLANYFNKDLKVSVFSLATNTPRSGFSFQDKNKFGLSDDDDKGFNEDEVFDWRQTDNNIGIPQSLTSGFYFTDKFGKNKRTKLGANYTFTDNRLKTNSDQTSQYFLTDTSYNTHLLSNHKSQEQSHELNLHFTQKLDSLSTLEIIPKFKYSIISQDNEDNTDYISASNSRVRNSYVGSYNKGTSTNFSTEAIYTKKFMKRDRLFMASYKFMNVQNGSDGNLKSNNTFYLGDTSMNLSLIDQAKNNFSNDMNHDVNIEYTEPFTQKFKMELKYHLNFNNGSQRKLTYNPQNGEYNLLDSTYSNQFTNNRMLNRFGVYFIFETKKHRVRFGAAGRNVLMENHNTFTLQDIHQNISNILPSFSYRYKFNEAHRIYFRYFTTSTQPTIAQLQPFTNNINPNRIVVGNADLKPSYTHNFNATYNIYKPLTGQYVFFGATYSVTNNGFSTATNFDNFGRTIAQTINSNNNQNGFLYLGAGIPFLNRKIKLKPSLNGNYLRSTNQINGLNNITTNMGATGALNLEFDFDSIYFNLGANFNYSSPKSSLNPSTSQPYTTQVYSAQFEWYLPLGFAIKTDATYNINGKRANGYNIKYLIWNASISKAFLKKQNLILSAEANDMLNQNINNSRSISSNMITDNKTKIISRYLLLRLTYKFSSTPEKADNRTNRNHF